MPPSALVRWFPENPGAPQDTVILHSEFMAIFRLE